MTQISHNNCYTHKQLLKAVSFVVFHVNIVDMIEDVLTGHVFKDFIPKIFVIKNLAPPKKKKMDETFGVQ